MPSRSISSRLLAAVSSAMGASAGTAASKPAIPENTWSVSSTGDTGLEISTFVKSTGVSSSGISRSPALLRLAIVSPSTGVSSSDISRSPVLLKLAIVSPWFSNSNVSNSEILVSVVSTRSNVSKSEISMSASSTAKNGTELSALNSSLTAMSSASASETPTLGTSSKSSWVGSLSSLPTITRAWERCQIFRDWRAMGSICSGAAVVRCC